MTPLPVPTGHFTAKTARLLAMSGANATPDTK